MLYTAFLLNADDADFCSSFNSDSNIYGNNEGLGYDCLMCIFFKDPRVEDFGIKRSKVLVVIDP